MASVPLPQNLVPCGGLDNDQNGCQSVYPYSNSARVLCLKCQKLAQADLSEVDRAKIEAYRSCSKCGVSEQRRIQRADRAQGMFNAGTKPLVDVTNHKVGPTTSAQELTEIRGATKASRWTIIYQVRVDSKIDNTYGNQTYSAEAEEPLSLVLNGILEQVNLRWTKTDGHFIALTAKFCELAFKNNYRIPLEAATLTVRGLYMYYAGRNERVLALGKDTNTRTRGLAKGTFMEMEIIISKVDYLKSVRSMIPPDESDSDSEQVPSKRKSKGNGDQVAKRSKQAVVLTSRFAPQSAFSIAVPEDFIRYTVMECVIDSATGAATLDHSGGVKSGKMEIKTLAGIRAADLGKSKDVYKVNFLGEPGPWVAKKFFDVGQGSGKGLESNELNLCHDLVSQKRLATFRDLFMQSARENAAEVAEFTVSPAHMIVVQSRSGTDVNEAYLVEPLRTSTVVEKFSGTIGGSDGIPNKLSSTMAAFAHFILESTACRMAFTDLQGSFHYPHVGAAQELVLFDPMTHSLTGNTGVGDHGPAGIEDTIQTHKCSFMCGTMKLASVASLKATFDVEKGKLDDMEQSDAELEEERSRSGFVLNSSVATVATASE
ncbi:kinase-like domain-containing protein [Mycena filopes]|nr:kinase-like domain-containing protein [Mycena filopes]